MPTSAVLTGLHVYPVKSCGGIALDEARLTPHGIEHDREWMLVDESGQFATQRTYPRLALVETELTAEALRLRAPGMASFEIPLKQRALAEHPAVVWGHATLALDEGDAASEWFGDFLHTRLRLVRWNPSRRRLSNLEWTGGIEAENYFADGYPYLVISEESLADLNRRLGRGSALPMNRFRPNLVIRGVAAYAEDSAHTLRSGAIDFRIVKPCTRCVMTATDQATAEVGVEPLRTLAGYRRDPRFNAPLFGQNAILFAGAGLRLKVGMEVVVDQAP
ncbi:MAG TPA: MOSC N-terminal beta barrel domain-containing protein [Candidatus Limnocylindria bacterium]|nr:MOSC N-terminal beta barrel domain-containing protein [Candidatus Limnocylindria bacterium]